MFPFDIASPADIGPDRTLLYWLDTSLEFCARPRLHLAVHWLRETARGQFGADLSRRFDSGVEVAVHATFAATLLVAVALDDEGRLRLRVSKWRSERLEVEARPESAESPEALLRSLFVFDSDAPARVATRLAGTVYQASVHALGTKCAAVLSRRTARGCALLDRSFDFTPRGMADFRSAATGESIRRELARALEAESAVEVHLPRFNRAEWPDRWDHLEQAQVVAEEDGRVFVSARKSATQMGLAVAAPLLYPESTGFEIGFTDSRTATAAELAQTLRLVLRPYNFGTEPWEWLASAPAGEVTASVSLSIPGDLAGAWLRGPAEKDPLFFDIYSKVSVAVQVAMRRWLPYVYFSDLSRFEDPPLAYALLLYRASYPCSGEPRSDFAYDLVASDNPGIARPWAARILTSALMRAERLLIGAGREELARRYRPWLARKVLAGILRRPRYINELLTNDAFFIERLVALALSGRDLALRMDADPRMTARNLAACIDGFSTAVNRKLKRLYGGQEAGSLGSLLMVEATHALASALGGEPAISATLHFSAQGRRQTFMNGAW